MLHYNLPVTQFLNHFEFIESATNPGGGYAMVRFTCMLSCSSCSNSVLGGCYGAVQWINLGDHVKCSLICLTCLESVARTLIVWRSLLKGEFEELKQKCYKENSCEAWHITNGV
jgi:hypothetical protein